MKVSDKKYIFFDLDGTISDSMAGIIDSVGYSLAKYGIYEEDRSVLKKFVGPPLKNSFMKFYGFSEEDADNAVKHYREYYPEHGIFKCNIYDGIAKLLEELSKKGKHILLATVKPEVFTERILERFDLRKYFDFVAGAQFTSRIEKDEIIKYAMTEYGIENPDECIMIGDRFHDIEGAHKNGIEVIGVLYGYGSREEMEEYGADYVVDSVKDLGVMLGLDKLEPASPDMFRLVGSAEQLYSVKKYTIEEGKGKGSSIYRVITGGALEYDVTPDNALDIANLTYKGINMCFISKNGSVVSPYAHVNYESEFDHTFPGGMLYTCGLLSTGGGTRDGDKWHPVHGRIHSIPGENCSGLIEDGQIKVSATMHETALFGHALELKRTISSELGTSKIVIEDVLSNLTPEDEEYMILYHMNFGYPFLSPDLKMILPPDTITTPRTKYAEKFIGRETEFTMPIDGEEETVFFNTDPQADSDGMATITLENAALGIGAHLRYSLDTLPVMAHWRCMRSGEYVLGIEPTNSYIMNRVREREHGTIGKIPAFSKINMRVELEFYDL